MSAKDALGLAWDFLSEARRQLRQYEQTKHELALRQACEKGWGAVAQALMFAFKKRIESHREFAEAASQLYKQTGEKAFLEGERAGEYLHSAGFYHGIPTIELVADSLDQIESLLKAVERI